MDTLSVEPDDMRGGRLHTDSGNSLSWYAVQVRSRQELTVSQLLHAKGYEHFLPTRKRQKRWSDRVREFEEPLFSGYTFCRLDPTARLPILTTPGVIQIIGTCRGPAPVDEAEIRALQKLVESGVQNQPCPFLEAGDRVRIESGPLRGLEGIFVSSKGVAHLVLSVTLLRRSIAVEMESVTVARIAALSFDSYAPEEVQELAGTAAS